LASRRWTRFEQLRPPPAAPGARFGRRGDARAYRGVRWLRHPREPHRRGFMQTLRAGAKIRIETLRARADIPSSVHT